MTKLPDNSGPGQSRVAGNSQDYMTDKPSGIENAHAQADAAEIEMIIHGDPMQAMTPREQEKYLNTQTTIVRREIEGLMEETKVLLSPEEVIARDRESAMRAAERLDELLPEGHRHRIIPMTNQQAAEQFGAKPYNPKGGRGR